MLTRIRVRNFKMFDDVDVELGGNTVLIGPNDSGKTSALQALALWELGLRRWREKHGEGPAPPRRPGATINRRDIVAVPLPSAKLLWNELHTHQVSREEGKQRTSPVFIDVVVDGVSDGREWRCGLEFYYANEESFYCRPLRSADGGGERMPVPDEAAGVSIAFLPPMSGLAREEPVLERGRIDVLIGEGQTAQVLRNLCYQIFIGDGDHDRWRGLSAHISDLFGIDLQPPDYSAERGEITMSYQTREGTELDISSSGRGCQQTLLVLAHLYANPATVLLIDEPDAHLEILRQRQIYQLITDVAREQGSQVIAASHSEVLLNEAAGRDTLVAFVGRPHRIDDRGSQAAKALKEIGFDQYYQAEQTGWVLYLEGSTDLAILQAFAQTLDHPAARLLDRPFVHYVGNQLTAAKSHFFGLREAKRDLVAVAVLDRHASDQSQEDPLSGLSVHTWRRREIENYLCEEAVLLRYARGATSDDLFSATRETAMRESITRMTDALEALRRPGPWSDDVKASDDFLDPLFEDYFARLGLPNLMRKTNYHELARLMEPDEIPAEVADKLNAIVQIAGRAHAGDAAEDAG